MSTKPFPPTDEAIMKQSATIGNYRVVEFGCVNMIEVVTIVLCLFCAFIFLAHAVDAYFT
jgi:hypothetical protein